MSRWDVFLLSTGILGFAALFLERIPDPTPLFSLCLSAAEWVVLASVVLDTLRGGLRAKYRLAWAKANYLSLLLTAGVVGAFLYGRLGHGVSVGIGSQLSYAVATVRNVSLAMKVFGRVRRLAAFVRRLTVHPAQTILASFAGVIALGTLALTLEWATVDGRGLPLVDALFTATSAVCVTGLIVRDTATVFTPFGWTAIAALIQIGGLGIMVLSYFTAVTLRRRMGLDGAMLVSYMTDEDDLAGATKALRGIVRRTFAIEGVGIALLFGAFRLRGGAQPGNGPLRDLGYAAFHAVSAFCNAGFALFTDSLEGFRDDGAVLSVIAALIILGGIGFATMGEAARWVRNRLRGSKTVPLSVNATITLRMTVAFLAIGTALIYLLEHDNVMAGYGLGEQYLSAFFQSVTLRTAGFNSIPFGALRPATYLIMMVFMFIGAAAGSTAGGIKLGTVRVLGAAVSSFLRNRRLARIGLHSVSDEKVIRASIILVFGICAVSGGAMLLAVTERAPLESLLFEVVSAFGTVGLSAGVTPSLTLVGKLVIVSLMFVGRLGPLTVLAAASSKPDRVRIEYPEADISLG